MMVYNDVRYYTGSTITARIEGGLIVRGTIIRFGYVDSRPVADLDNNHWCFLSQIINEW